MKRILLSAITLLFLTAIAKADGLLVAGVGIQPGKTTTVQVSLNSTGESFRAVLFSLTLPTGIHVATDEYGELVTTADERLTAAGYSVTANHLDDGSDRFAVMNIGGNAVIPTECGPLFTFTIEADAGLTPGDVLTGTLSGIKLTDAYAEDHQADDVTFSVTVEESRTILDETSDEMPEAEENANVRVNRTIKANEWSTICLPFAMTEAQVKAAFGDDVRLGDADSYKTTEDDAGNVVGINIKFNNVTAIEANHPYIIKVSKDITSFDVDGVDVAPAERERNRRKSLGTGSYFVGNYVNQTEVPEFCLFLSGNKFWYSIGDTQMKAFRGYFDLKDVLTSVEDTYSSRIAMSFSNEETGIAKIEDGKMEMDDCVFDLQGRRMESSMFNSQSSIQKKGVYIVNGKKYVNR